MNNLWTSEVKTMTALAIKQAHNADMVEDKKMRWQVRKNFVKEGVLSNLFPVLFKPDAYVWKYRMEVVRPATPKGGDQRARKPRPTPPLRIWRMFSLLFQSTASLPPYVQLQSYVYTTQPLPQAVLTLPREYYDIGWQSCNLVEAGKVQISQMPKPELRHLLNKVLPWALRQHSKVHGNFSCVREVDGKLVSLNDGVSVAGLRIFRGTTACMLHVLGAETNRVKKRSLQKPMTGNRIGSLINEGIMKEEIQVRCQRKVKTFEYKGKKVSSYVLADTSGSLHFTCWKRKDDVFLKGKDYVISNFKLKKGNPKFLLAGCIPMEAESLTTTKITEVGTNDPTDTVEESEVQATDSENAEEDDGKLALRLDTRCTVATENSLWTEVKNHFGAPPYSEEQQQRITRVVLNTPVVVSTNLHHSKVRTVRFDFRVPNDAPLDKLMQTRASLLEHGQPYAILRDFSVVPLQALHCCYDPRMRSWLDITVPACSFLPTRRIDVLHVFRKALTPGLEKWGAEVALEGWKTGNVKLLESPKGSKELEDGLKGTGAKSALLDNKKQGEGNSSGKTLPLSVLKPFTLAIRPKLMAFVSIYSPKHTEEEQEILKASAVALGIEKQMPDKVSHVEGEQQALKAVLEMLVSRGTLMDKNCCAVFVTKDRGSRASRWLRAQCLKRGILPVMTRPTQGDKGKKKSASSVSQQIKRAFDNNVLRGMNLGQYVPQLNQKSIIVIGIDACHTASTTILAVFALGVSASGENHIQPTFWKAEVRGRESENVVENFARVLKHMTIKMNNRLDEVIVFQDGSINSEVAKLQQAVPSSTSLSFICLHKRSHIRFVGTTDNLTPANAAKGSVVEALTPVPEHETNSHNGGTVALAPSFFLQNHDCFMSTARTVQYVVHLRSPNLNNDAIQRLSYFLSHAASPLSTKLPLPTRCAHSLAAAAERLIDAYPDFTGTDIPEPLRSRMWFT